MRPCLGIVNSERTSNWKKLFSCTEKYTKELYKGTRWSACTSDKVVPTARSELNHFKTTRRCNDGRAPNTCTWYFPDVIKFRVAAHTISEKAIRFRYPDYNPDRARKLMSSSMFRHLSTRNILSKSMHAFLSNLANRQTDKRTPANAFTSSFLGGN